MSFGGIARCEGMCDVSDSYNTSPRQRLRVKRRTNSQTPVPFALRPHLHLPLWDPRLFAVRLVLAGRSLVCGPCVALVPRPNGAGPTPTSLPSLTERTRPRRRRRRSHHPTPTLSVREYGCRRAGPPTGRSALHDESVDHAHIQRPETDSR